MSDIISQMRKSNSELIKTEASDLAKWSKLKHIKSDLELFLQFNVAEIKFKTNTNTDSSVICTSNTTLIKILAAKKEEDKKKLMNFKNSGIKTKDKNSVLTWDLIDNKYKTINLASWFIVNFISIFPENILLLDEVINKILKK